MDLEFDAPSANNNNDQDDLDLDDDLGESQDSDEVAVAEGGMLWNLLRLKHHLKFHKRFPVDILKFCPCLNPCKPSVLFMGHQQTV